MDINDILRGESPCEPRRLRRSPGHRPDKTKLAQTIPIDRYLCQADVSCDDQESGVRVRYLPHTARVCVSLSRRIRFARMQCSRSSIRTGSKVSAHALYNMYT